MKELPIINDKYDWCCENGCGRCMPVQREIVIYEARDVITGEFFHRETETRWLSDCCEADLMLFDNDNEEFVNL